MELDTEGLEEDSILKDETPQPLSLAELPEHQQPGLCLFPFTRLQPTPGKKVKGSSVETVSNQVGETTGIDTWGPH